MPAGHSHTAARFPHFSSRILKGLLISILLGCPMDGGASNIPSLPADSLISIFGPNAQVGLTVLDAHTGVPAAERNSRKNMIPASTLKLFTTWAALVLLGPETRLKTSLGYTGIISGATLKGNLVIRGGGDPAFCSGFFGEPYSRKAIFNRWQKALRNKGVKHVEGCVYGDARAIKSLTPNPHALWEDIGNYYGAITSGLCFMDNRYRLFFSGADSAGKPVSLLRSEPASIGINHFSNSVLTSPAGGVDSAYILGSPLSLNRLLAGTYPAGNSSFNIKGSLPHPAWTSAMEFFHHLSSTGIQFKTGNSCREYQSGPVTTAFNPDLPESIQVLSNQLSPSIAELARHVNHRSDNTYAEQLLCLLGKRHGGSGDFRAGLREMMGCLSEAGLDTHTLNFKDGSGLSRYNWVSSRQTALLLKAAANDDSHFKPFLNSLPRLTTKGSRYGNWGKTFQGNLWLKTGYLEGVYAMAGYLKTRKGKLLCFAFMVNHCPFKPPAVRAAVFRYLSGIMQTG